MNKKQKILSSALCMITGKQRLFDIVEVTMKTEKRKSFLDTWYMYYWDMNTYIYIRVYYMDLYIQILYFYELSLTLAPLVDTGSEAAPSLELFSGKSFPLGFLSFWLTLHIHNNNDKNITVVKLKYLR